MPIFRLLAVLVLAQGVFPIVAYGLEHPASLASLGVLFLYIPLALGLWWRQRWALPLGAIVTLPQLLVFSTHTASWCCYVGITAGFNILPDGDFLQGVFHPFLMLGLNLHVSNHLNPRFLPTHGLDTAWLGINLWAVWILYFLGRLWFARRSLLQPE